MRSERREGRERERYDLSSLSRRDLLLSTRGDESSEMRGRERERRREQRERAKGGKD